MIMIVQNFTYTFDFEIQKKNFHFLIKFYVDSSLL